jgi:hypothetical protein
VNTENLLLLIGEIDERYISEAAPQKDSEIVMETAAKKPSLIILKAISIAACIVVLTCAAIVALFFSGQGIEYDDSP